MDRLFKKRLAMGKRSLIVIDQDVNDKKMSRCTFCTGHVLFGYIKEYTAGRVIEHIVILEISTNYHNVILR